MINYDEAVEILKKHIIPQTKTETIDILDAYGYILAEDIYSKISVPPFPKSAMDGYAVYSNDIISASKCNPVKLNVIGNLMAGDICSNIIGHRGEAVRIMTGGHIPEGFDCIVKQEDTNYDMNVVSIFKSADSFSNYCKIGEDIKEGQLILKKYTKINNFHIGILASVGIPKIKVLSPMRVCIISTGNEIVSPEYDLKESQIYNSCSYVIASKLKSVGINVVFIENCFDDIKNIKQSIEKGVEKSDILITTGGVSVGEKDLIPYTMEEIGAYKLFKKVNIKPGTPVTANKYKEKIILSFSGNPFAAMVNFELFFWYAVSEFMNNKTFEPEVSYSILKNSITKKNNLRRFLRAFESNGEVSCISDKQVSSVLYDMLNCNCFIEQPEDKVLNCGELVKIIKFK